MLPTADYPELLVADDSANDVVLFHRLVEKAALRNRVVAVSDGAEAIAYLQGSCPHTGLLRRPPPTVVFLDLHMPFLDGFEVLRWIRCEQRCFKTTVVMLTDSDDPADLRRAAVLGANGYLLKHPHPLVIASIVRQSTCSTLDRAPAAALPAGDGFVVSGVMHTFHSLGSDGVSEAGLVADARA